MIPVTKPYLPDRKRYLRYIDRCYETGQLTNNGPLVQELKKRLEEYLGVENLLLVANGTLALQIAYKTLDVTKKAITTPFTFVATSSSLRWEGIEPVYADIDGSSLNLNPEKVRETVGSGETAIVPVHVYGNPCDLNIFEEIAKENDLKLVYDAAHAFGVRCNGRSVLKWGDASTLSFHATKIFHTIEGGGIVFRKREDYLRASKLVNFGLDGNDIVDIGINAKMSEFHAAMGLSVLDDIRIIIKKRKELFDLYFDSLQDHVEMPSWNEDAMRNYGYFPILFSTERSLLKTQALLNRNEIFPRRYFFPSLDTIYNRHSILINPVSQDVTRRVLCLPIYPSLPKEVQTKIVSIVKANA